MSVWDIILKIIVVAICGVGAYYIVIFSIYFWSIAEFICEFIKSITEFVSAPFVSLWNLIKKKLSSFKPVLKQDIITRFAERHPILGSATSIKLFILSSIFLATLIIIYAVKGIFGDFLTQTMSMLPFFFILGIINGDFQFSFVGLISVGVSSMLIGAFFNLCIGNYSRKGSFVRWLVSIGYYIVTTFTACYIGFALSSVWDFVASKGVALFGVIKGILTSSSWTFVGTLKIISSALVLLAILYIGIILVTIAIKEYIESLCYGGLGAILFFMTILVLWAIFSQDFLNGPIGQFITFTTLFAAVFIFDFIRVNKDEILEKKQAIE